MPDLTDQQVTLALAIVGAVALLSFLITLVLMVRLRKIRRTFKTLRGTGEERDIIATLGHSVDEVRRMGQRLDAGTTAQEDLAALGRLSLQRFALVRYDAFEDMGGQLSFSTALLDDYGDGVVITSINGRTETRTYAKPIKQLDSAHNLSDEEREAISEAAGGRGRGEGEASSQGRGPRSQPAPSRSR